MSVNFDRRIIFKTAEQGVGSYYHPYERLAEPQKEELYYLAEIVRSTPLERLKTTLKMKRIADIIIASVALVLLSPVLIIAAILIKLESPGPVFFTQERIGLNRRRNRDRRKYSIEVPMDKRKGTDRRKTINPGKPFKIYKLRTMVINAEKDGPTLSYNGDPRITRIGRLLRMTRIDEIPQFINVIKGDMSIVGPRPERAFYINQVAHETPVFPLRLFVKPGITGLAQVENGYTNTIDQMKEKLFYDLKYISELSVWQELKIIIKTFYVVLTGKGAC